MFETHAPSLFAALLQRDHLKSLTLTQPWATLMTVGAKCIETRSWCTDYQGPLVIHAAKGFPGWARDCCEEEPFRSVLEKAGYDWKPERKQNPWGLPLGQVVAIGWLDRVERITMQYPVNTVERAFGNYAPGRYAWHVSRIYRLSTPIEARGSLGVWNWQPSEGFWREIQAQHDRELISREEVRR